MHQPGFELTKAIMKSTLLVIFLGLTQVSLGQKNDSLPARRNTIKFHLVTSMLYAKSGAVSFERVVKSNQTFSIMAGYVQFPLLGSLGDSISSSSTNRKNTGFVVGGEYRYYMKKENKFAAPHGVYWGPFVNYFFFHNQQELTYTPSSGIVNTAGLKTDINVLNIGVQLGYQFLLNDRWTIDMVVFGPSLSYYSLDTEVSGTIDESILSSKLAQALADRFPLVKDLMEDQKANVHGHTGTWNKGFRYQLNVGYHFGRKKK